jgi:hypothetical protein
MLEGPLQVATDTAGNIYVADERPREITVFAPDGTYVGSVELTDLTDAEILGAFAIDGGEEGTFYVLTGGGDDPAAPILTVMEVTIALPA